MKNYEEIKQNIKNKATLCIVSKYHTKNEIYQYYQKGERIFAESRAQELLQKINIANDIQWHFIGHLQRNKVKMLLPHLSCIQSLDNLILANIIEKECSKLNRSIDILVEVHLAKNDMNKTGIDEHACIAFITECLKLSHLNLKGIMVMGPHTNDENEIHQVFQSAQLLFHRLQKHFGPKTIQILSMGMSSDYRIALKYGANLVRIGHLLFD